MWTPKRLLLLVFGFVLFFAAYEVYTLLLGKYDGLPPLPDDFADVGDDGPPLPEPAPHMSSAEIQLEKAFGKGCPELARPIKLHWRVQGVVLAAEKHMLLGNGQLRLKKVSVAIFGKPKPDAKGEDINTVRGEQADIEFDKPIKSLRDATNPDRKPIAGRLEGNVVLKNNRRTPDPKDDIELHTQWLQYRDEEHRVWTDAPVRIVDGDPEQHTVDAIGMQVFLIPNDEPKNAPVANKELPAAKKPRSSISGVKSVHLQSDIHMVMLLDGKSNFMGGPPKSEPNAPAGGQAKAAKGAGPGSQEKTMLFINAQGPFLYEPGTDKDRAEFNHQVNVIRKLDAAPKEKTGPTDTEHYDQLDCDKLVLFFEHKKSDDKSRATDDPGQDLDLTFAHATGKQVELVSDSQHLHATCNDLQYDKKANRTTLLGDPELVADKDKARLRMRGKLTLQHPPADSKDKDIQEAHAEGPGEITMRSDDKKPEQVARWNDTLHSVKEGLGDRYTLLGQASIEDPERGHLEGDQLIFWVEPIARDQITMNAPQAAKSSDPANGKPDGKGTGPEETRRLRRMEANKNVKLDSKELKIPKADRLHIEFADVPGAGAASSNAVPAKPMGSGSAAAVNGLTPFEEGGTSSIAPKFNQPAAVNAPGAGNQPSGVLPQEGGSKQPIELTARSVDAKVARDGNRNELREVHAEGVVHVIQQGSNPEDKGIEIKGDALDLTGTPDGHILKVVAPQAYVQLDKITIIGPEVNIDQPKNEAWVNGLGSMKLPTKTDFQGNPLDKPTDVLIYWNKGMWFNGKYAEYNGGVQAVQGPDSRLRTLMLQVVLDRFVSLKERQTNGNEPQAALYRMLCDKDVELENGVHEGVGPRARWREYQRITGDGVAFDNPESQLKVSGPGEVWLLKPGSKHDGPLDVGPQIGGPKQNPPPKPSKPDGKAGAKDADSELKLTRVAFEGTMVGNKITGIVTFRGRVRLVHLPADEPDIALNVDKLPPSAMRVDCDVLKVAKLKINEKEEEQIFEAKDHVHVKGRNYDGQADVLTYEESKDLMILKGINGNLARLSRQARPNGPFEPVTAKEIKYWRKENRIEFSEARDIGVFGK